MGSTEYIEDTGSKLDRQPDVDCPAFYIDEDIKQACILPIGHDGPHVDCTGIEFSSVGPQN
jgi:hypothetical protein